MGLNIENHFGIFANSEVERISYSPFRPGGVHQDLPPHLLAEQNFINTLPKNVADLETLLTDNRIFKQRSPVDIGVVKRIRRD